jgi:hypothetical protein
MTQLIWLQWQICEKLWGTYDDALTGANTLQDGECGLTDGSSPGDWRMPNLYELLSVLGGISPDSLTQPLPAPFTLGDNSAIATLWEFFYCPRVTSSAQMTKYVYVTEEIGITRADKTTVSAYGWAVRGGN